MGVSVAGNVSTGASSALYQLIGIEWKTTLAVLSSKSESRSNDVYSWAYMVFLLLIRFLTVVYSYDRESL